MGQERTETAVDGLLSEEATLNSYKRLYGTPRSRLERTQGIRRMYQRLVRWFSQPINPLHLAGFPAALDDLPDDLLVLAFERAEQHEPRFCPLPGRLRELVACDEREMADKHWAHWWGILVPALKRHGVNWTAIPGPVRLDSDGRMLKEPSEPIQPPELPPPLTHAIQRLGAGSFREGLTFLKQYHPIFYGADNWPYPESPRLAAEKVEAQVRALYEAGR